MAWKLKTSFGLQSLKVLPPRSFTQHNQGNEMKPKTMGLFIMTKTKRNKKQRRDKKNREGTREKERKKQKRKEKEERAALLMRLV